ncbi:heme o synthase [Variovorax guangxiensis]|uniref:heme o synthase n=1 Tax=Variovorax guangxiensis TaxID=1775474 RepID=UPI00285E71A2|nr:heme o synthase [Variovorax guangxiensis]MDR6858530.1 protoheme IX farnesyltransferase [Variovorax guangxiensis]
MPPSINQPRIGLLRAQSGAHRLRGYISLTKPRVVTLIVFTAVIGMFLVPGPLPLVQAVFGAIGIALVAAAAAATNCLLEAKRDAVMARTRWRPLASGRLKTIEAATLAAGLGVAGLAMLHALVNPLTMWLTLATFAGYAIVYTLLLKPRTPQNIVLGGAAGAMPPVLGWAAVTGEVSANALLLFLIIFVWTPPHFWSLALYRRNDYAKAGVPMLPVTHGMRYTRRQVLLYTLGLVVSSVLPFFTGMSGVVYLASALSLGAIFIAYATALWRRYSDKLARATFRYSIAYLALLFAALLVDHYL